MANSKYLERMNEIKYAKHDELYPDISKVTLKLELNNSCNHSCIFCFHAHDRGDAHFMDKDLAYRLMREGRECGIKEICFHSNGEPFLVKDLHEYIRHAKEIGYSYVFINTNGALATPERLREVVEAGVDSIKFSINAATRETYQKIHGRDDFDKVMEHLKYLKNYREENKYNFKIYSTFALTKYSEKEVESYKEIITPLVDEFVITVAHNSGGQMQDDFEKYKMTDDNAYQFITKQTLPCSMLFDFIFVRHNGDLITCPEDYYGYLTTCNLKNMSLKDAWYNNKMIELRKRHIQGDVSKILCDKCLNNVAEIEPICSDLCRKMRS